MAILKDTEFSGANLRTANLIRVDLHGCRFHRSHMQWSILNGARLQDNNLTEANLQFCDFSDAIMSGDDFSGAFFHNAYLGNAVMRNVNLTDTKDTLARRHLRSTIR